MRAPEFWYNEGPVAHGLATILSPFGWAYGAHVRHSARQAKPYRARARVVCVGNLTAGGTGKTPVVAALAQHLRKRGAEVRILTRGYGGTLRGPLLVDPSLHNAQQVGDEALMLTRVASVIVSADRAAGAKLADSMGADVLVMDDGYQNFGLEKDVSLVVVDSGTAFGNGRVIPAGPLREPIAQGLERADAAIVLGSKDIILPAFDKPVLRATLAPEEALELRERCVVAFAGIGRPEKFFTTLRRLGAQIVRTCSFPDHHLYTPAELKELRRDALRREAMLLTTEKDFVRIPVERRNGIQSLPVSLRFADAGKLNDLLLLLAPPAKPHSVPQ